MSDKKYYWLKLHRDFFKRHDVKIIEAQENGKDYIIFYLKLLTECIDHEGTLRFSTELPYDEKMLSIITDTNIDVVRSAVSAFTKMGLMERWDDGTYFMSKIDKMIGSENTSAIRKRRQRALEENKRDIITKVSQDSNKKVTQSKRLELELEKEIEKEGIGRTRKRFQKPTMDEVKEYSDSIQYPDFDVSKFIDFYDANGWKVGKNAMKDWKATLRNWKRRDNEVSPAEKREQLRLAREKELIDAI